MRVAVLGTGIMGTGMAHSLLRSGLDVTVWNRSSGRAAPLAADGARVAGTAAEAVADADAVITILWDGNSVADVMADALPAALDGVLWVQASTVSVHDAGDMLAALADGCGARYVDAPVLGTRQPAEEGKLTVLTDEDESLDYGFDELDELAHAYATTIHRSQGSEYPAVVIPLTTSSWMMLRRNLLYTAITRAKKLAVLVGSERALAAAVRTPGAGRRHTGLTYRINGMGPLTRAT